jgi:cold-inducible RNA-binding protein
MENEPLSFSDASSDWAAVFPESALIFVGEDHYLASPEPLTAMHLPTRGNEARQQERSKQRIVPNQREKRTFGGTTSPKDLAAPLELFRCLVTNIRKYCRATALARRGPSLWCVILSEGGQEVAKKLYVGNLSYDMTDSDLQGMFESHGTVQSAQVIMDRETGRSKGFGFVEMSNDQEAQGAISALNGKEVNGRALTVNEARPREDRGGGGGRGRGGFGGRR